LGDAEQLARVAEGKADLEPPTRLEGILFRSADLSPDASHPTVRRAHAPSGARDASPPSPAFMPRFHACRGAFAGLSTMSMLCVETARCPARKLGHTSSA
jgi:hypothetical protein